MAEEILLKFRHESAGDIGPISFPESTTFTQVKERLLSEWPKGSNANEAPSQGTDVKLILSGKFIESAKTLKDYKKDMGELKADTVVTLLVFVRPQAAVKKPSAPSAKSAPKTTEEEAKGCSCSIS
ncbi:hypothetical protein CEUSTIGMA_g3607.t1 [Chlamydomonas eustigma]|uniref:UBL3-like ubiquitin domain-containing protein n=1 Tax=Chlamydomonas eustigma TaxID=1157962 RepID=A0A250WZ93_9CHLO|nr:hypothetical protein CEUSTIGMA_g3607.t1 [Chlamydomonas eustigma]|eukprot:GAX76163.1 hypothetical protein CEUSTIGMA_g3607.t1 [Chlamydomonas eustigma]